MLYQVIVSFYDRDFPFLYRCSFLSLFFFSDKEVKEHLTHYLASARELRPETGHLLQVCQLFVHCWEVSFGITIYQFTRNHIDQPNLIMKMFSLL